MKNAYAAVNAVATDDAPTTRKRGNRNLVKDKLLNVGINLSALLIARISDCAYKCIHNTDVGGERPICFGKEIFYIVVVKFDFTDSS